MRFSSCGNIILSRYIFRVSSDFQILLCKECILLSILVALLVLCYLLLINVEPQEVDCLINRSLQFNALFRSWLPRSDSSDLSFSCASLSFLTVSRIRLMMSFAMLLSIGWKLLSSAKFLNAPVMIKHSMSVKLKSCEE